MKLQKNWKRLYINLLVGLKKFKRKFQTVNKDIEVELYDLNKVAVPYFKYFNFFLVVLAVVSLVLSEAFILTEKYNKWNTYLEFAIVGGFFLTYTGRLLLTSKRGKLIRSRLMESLLIFLLLFFGSLLLFGQQEIIVRIGSLFGYQNLLPLLLLFTKIYLIILVVNKLLRAAPVILSLKRKPTQVVAGSFLLMIVVGTFLLMTPRATADSLGLDFIDALFTATSAVCVTGLIVVDTATHLSMFGQVLVLILIQVGGLGIITVATLFALFVSRELGVGQMAFLKGSIGESRTNETFGTVKRIVWITLLIEAIGAVSYYFSWDIDFGSNSRRIFFSIFHAVSAFCNAGFSTFTNSFADSANATNWAINITTILLIIIGGLGFTTIWEIIRGNPNRRYHNRKYSLHARLVIISTIFLIVFGTAGFLLLEWKGTLAGYGSSEKILFSLFQSVTTRTAGFNTIEISELDISTTLMILTLMIIGASPASTAGGIKTTTVCVLLIAVWSTIRGKNRIEFAKKTISSETVLTAQAVLILFTMCLFIFTFALTITEDLPFIDLLFEEFSAFATVGLSRGITSSLSVSGKSIIILSMFIGRVGIITLALAFANKSRSTKYSYPTEGVIVA